MGSPATRRVGRTTAANDLRPLADVKPSFAAARAPRGHLQGPANSVTYFGNKRRRIPRSAAGPRLEARSARKDLARLVRGLERQTRRRRHAHGEVNNRSVGAN